MKKGFKEMLPTIKENWNRYMNEFKKCFDDLKHKETFYKQIPNLLTASRAVGMIPVNILFLTGNMVPGIILLGMLLSTDFFDGKIARKYGIESKFGADLDAICDKIMAIGLMIPLFFVSPLLLINVLLEGIIAIMNVTGRLKGLNTKTLFSGKVKTWFLSLTLGLGYLTKFIPSGYVAFVLSSLVTMPIQIKAIFDYKKYIAREEKINMINEMNNNYIDLEQVLSDREQKIEDLKKEKEFLLSIQEEVDAKSKIKIKK